MNVGMDALAKHYDKRSEQVKVKSVGDILMKSELFTT